MVATGPWLNDLLRPLGMEQQIESSMSQASVFRGTGWEARPCLIEWDRDGAEAAYGLPIAGSGYQIGLHPTASWIADDEERRPDHAEALALARRVDDRFVASDHGRCAPSAVPRRRRRTGTSCSNGTRGAVLARSLLRARFHVLARAGRGDRGPRRGHATTRAVPDEQTRVSPLRANLESYRYPSRGSPPG